jgi:hypothetical protein
VWKKKLEQVSTINRPYINYAAKIQMRICNADQEMKMTNLSINSTPSVY